MNFKSLCQRNARRALIKSHCVINSVGVTFHKMRDEMHKGLCCGWMHLAYEISAFLFELWLQGPYLHFGTDNWLQTVNCVPFVQRGSLGEWEKNILVNIYVHTRVEPCRMKIIRLKCGLRKIICKWIKTMAVRTLYWNFYYIILSSYR